MSASAPTFLRPTSARSSASFAKPKYRGAHGHPPTIKEMAATLILWGDGIRQGATLDDVPMVDIAPTVATLLGFSMRNIERPLLRALSGSRCHTLLNYRNMII